MKFNFNTNIDKNSPIFSNEQLTKIFSRFKETINDEQNGFFHLTNNQELTKDVKEVYKSFQHKKHFVQIGIGGSALGPQMLVSALRKNWDKTFTLLDNVDSDYITDELRKIDIQDALFYVVSKSGGTAETIACYAIVREMLLATGIKTEDLNKYFVFCTDKSSGQLRTHVDTHNYTSLIVPSNVGGRFSVLTHVGLLPALFMGINIDQLLEGANKIKEDILSENIEENLLLKTASQVFHLYSESTPSVSETVLMPYSSKLKDLSFWFVQLWAESLGKFSETSNKPVGLTPIPAYGATDQHSQVQLFMEGPNNKFLFMLHIDQKETNFDLESSLDLESAQKLAPYSMNELMEAEFNGSLMALKENERNFISININRLDETNIGQLIMFFESLTAIMGSYLEVDTFNQPGVEKGKKYAYEYLNSLGK
jgi:glucose-6-phosphate isomerase